MSARQQIFDYNVIAALTVTDCPSCFMTFAVPARFLQERRTDAKTFYCPAGHRMSYEDSEADKLRRERDRLKQNAAYDAQRIARAEEERDHAKSQAAGFKGAMRKVQKRAAAGTCPCCARSFANMAAHMLKQHPEFVADHVEPAPPRKEGDASGDTP